MRIIIVLVFCCFVSKFSIGQTINNFSVINTEGQKHNLQNDSGIKILIFILPSLRANDDSTYLKWINSIAITHANKMQVIGVPSYEDNYNDSLALNLNTFYRTYLDSTIFITKGMYTHKTSSRQDALFSWLTNSAQNQHFDIDVAGPGEMFFINETGGLYGVFGPASKYSQKVINYMIP